MKKLMMIVMVAVLVLPTMAQNAQEWQTSTLQGSGSAYTPQVTAVGATTATPQATTTSGYSPAKAPGGARRGYDANGEWTPDAGDLEYGGDTGQSAESPLGDAVLPLLMMALAFAGVVYLRRKKNLKTEG